MFCYIYFTMAKKYDFFGMSESGGDMLFDLRTIRARLIGLHLLDIKKAKEERNYPEWFRNIKILFGVIDHLIDKENEWKELITEANILANKYANVYLGKSINAVGVGELEDAFIKLEMFLYKHMEGKGVFGKKEDYRGL